MKWQGDWPTDQHPTPKASKKDPPGRLCQVFHQIKKTLAVGKRKEVPNQEV